MVTEVRPLQPEKAELPMLVTELGMVTEIRLLQPLKALYPIRSTVDGIVTFAAEPTYAVRWCFVESVYTKSPSV